MAGAVHPVNQPRIANDRSIFADALSWLQTGVFVCLSAVAVCAPLSTKGAVNGFRAALILWVISLCLRRVKLAPQPLALPMLLFLALTGLSSVFSLDPFLSWGRMRSVCLILLAIVIGQVLRSMRQVKIMAALLIGSCLLTVIYTGWQYTAGIGVQASANGPAVAALRRFGLSHGDILREINGTPIHTPGDLFRQELPSRQARLVLWRETPNGLQPFHVNVNGKALQVAMRSSEVTLSRAHPPRAQGFFKHYFPFSEILVLVGLLMWGIAVSSTDTGLRTGLFLASLATLITLALTLTRISLVSFLVGGFLIVAVGARGKLKWISIASFVLLALAGLYWVQRHRSAPDSDPGTEYRLMMWRDSPKMMRAHPLLGVGLDAVAGDWQRWNLQAYRTFGLHSHFHSTPIQLAVECGLPALLVWVWLLAGLAVFLLRLGRKVGANELARGIALGGLGGLAAFIITGFLQYNFGDAEAMVVFWLVIGLSFASHRLVAKSTVAWVNASPDATT
jgi:O-antigen ligase